MSGEPAQADTSIGGLVALTFLEFGRKAGLSGSIPSSLGGLTGLTALGLAYNALSGTMPSALGALTKLTYLTLDNNALTGPVPSAFCSLQPSIDLQVQSNPGLTCHPPCLLTFTSLNKDASLDACSAGEETIFSPNHSRRQDQDHLL